MPRNWTFLGLLALILVISAGMLAPASAEFFGCNDKPGKVLAVYYMNRRDDPIQMNGGVRHIAQTVFTPE